MTTWTTISRGFGSYPDGLLLETGASYLTTEGGYVFVRESATEWSALANGTATWQALGENTATWSGLSAGSASWSQLETHPYQVLTQDYTYYVTTQDGVRVAIAYLDGTIWSRA